MSKSLFFKELTSEISLLVGEFKKSSKEKVNKLVNVSTIFQSHSSIEFHTFCILSIIHCQNSAIQSIISHNLSIIPEIQFKTQFLKEFKRFQNQPFSLSFHHHSQLSHHQLSPLHQLSTSSSQGKKELV
ncbi:MAG: hypothetical protein LBU14_02130 [Candidatus Peribacteria bacterium]|jgi:hypothetical protein|nr:hypothetical protein [Candidatus Peribacteria bacterium]